LPPDYGDWSNTHRCFIRWRDKGIWEKLLEVLIDDPDYEWLMIDASRCKVHPHAAGAKGGDHDMNRTKGGGAQHQDTSGRGCAHGMPVRVFITQGTTADCTQAGRLIEGLDADYLLADRGYDSNAIIEQARKQGMEAIIPPKKNRTAQRFC